MSMLATITPRLTKSTRTTPATRRPARRPVTRRLTAGELGFLRKILHDRDTPNAVLVSAGDLYVGANDRLYASLGHPRISERLTRAGLIRAVCRRCCSLLGDVSYQGTASVTEPGLLALRTGRVRLD